MTFRQLSRWLTKVPASWVAARMGVSPATVRRWAREGIPAGRAGELDALEGVRVPGARERRRLLRDLSIPMLSELSGESPAKVSAWKRLGDIPLQSRGFLLDPFPEPAISAVADDSEAPSSWIAGVGDTYSEGTPRKGTVKQLWTYTWLAGGVRVSDSLIARVAAFLSDPPRGRKVGDFSQFFIEGSVSTRYLTASEGSPQPLEFELGKAEQVARVRYFTVGYYYPEYDRTLMSLVEELYELSKTDFQLDFIQLIVRNRRDV